MNPDHAAEWDLQAYVDRRLPAERRPFLLTLLAHDRPRALRVAALLGQRRMLVMLRAHFARSPLPPRLERLALRLYWQLRDPVS